MHRTVPTIAVALALMAGPTFLGRSGAAGAEVPGKQAKTTREADVVYVPTPYDVTTKMLELAAAKRGDLVYDLGCGDGRIVVVAAGQFGCRAVGYEIDPERVKEANRNVQKRKVERLVRIEQKDIFALDLREANVVTLYLLPELNLRLVPQLEKLKPGSRIVSHDFAIGGVVAEKVVTMVSNEDNVEHTVYLYGTPLKKATREN